MRESHLITHWSRPSYAATTIFTYSLILLIAIVTAFFSVSVAEAVLDGSMILRHE
jgi:hypothetical protein